MTRYTKEASRLLKTPEFAARVKELGESNLKSAINKYGEEQGKTLNKTAIQAMKVKADRLGFEAATKEFKQKAASVATDLYGGYGKISKNPTMNTIARVTLLAPDFYKTHVNLMGRLIKGVGQDAARLVGKGAGASVDNKIYRTLAANTAVVTTALDVLNKHMSGKHIWENDNGHEMSLNTGVKDSMGRNVYVRVFGGAEDLPRLIATMAHSVKQNMESGLNTEDPFEDAKKFIMNRLSPIFKPIAQFADNSDYKGEGYHGAKPYAVRVSVPGYGKKTIREGYSPGHALGKLAGDYSQVVSPQALQPLIDSAVQSLLGDKPRVPSSREQIKSQIMELPLSFKMPYSGIRDVAKRKILTPEERKAKLLEQRRYQKLALEQIQREAR